MHGALLQYADALKARNIDAEIIRNASDLQQYASDQDDLIFLGDGIFPEESLESDLLEQSIPALNFSNPLSPITPSNIPSKARRLLGTFKNAPSYAPASRPSVRAPTKPASGSDLRSAAVPYVAPFDTR